MRRDDHTEGRHEERLLDLQRRQAEADRRREAWKDVTDDGWTERWEAEFAASERDYEELGGYR